MTPRVIFMVILLSICTPFFAHAVLNDNEDGTITQTRNDGSILMWLQDVNTASTSGYCSTPGNCFDTSSGRMDWYQANNWIQFLNDNNYLGFNDWRLPDTLPVNESTYDYTFAYDGSTDRGYNITSLNSEMAYMFYVELNNIGLFDTNGTVWPSGWGLSNTEPFTNLTSETYAYWSASDGIYEDRAFYFAMDTGLQESHAGKALSNYWAWAVHDVTVVPEPISSMLFISGGALLAGRRLRIQKSGHNNRLD